jgi:type II secretion system protein H
MQGFTLIELMIVVIIAAILAAVAVPSFRSIIRSIAVRGAASELVAGMQYARSEALRNNRDVTFVLEQRKWQIFLDKNKNNTYDAGDDLLRENTYTDQIQALPNRWMLLFHPSGLMTIKTPVTAFPAGICLETSNSPRITRLVRLPARVTSPVVEETCP